MSGVVRIVTVKLVIPDIAAETPAEAIQQFVDVVKADAHSLVYEVDGVPVAGSDLSAEES